MRRLEELRRGLVNGQRQGRAFRKLRPLRTLEQISADIVAIEKEGERIIDRLLKVAAQ